MKSVEPKADLPPASSQTMLTYSALPIRRPYHQSRDTSRNMTGIYLSHNPYVLPSNKQHQQKIPPLARPRGSMYHPQMMHGSYRQHQQDAQFRKRGDGKSFQPMPIKKSKPKLVRHEYHAPSAHVIGPRADYQAVTRKSARRHVPASNDGVTHFEDLRSLSSGHSDKLVSQEIETVENMLESIDLAARESERSLAGLVECYKKICKGNAPSINNLMSSRTSPNFKHKKRKSPTDNVSAPLVIRSFRNPQHPHSVVQYSDPRDQDSLTHSTSRPPVPAPYFYSSRGLPQTTDESGSRVRLTRLPGAPSRSSDIILAAPGAGSITKSAGSRRSGSVASSRPPEGVSGTRPPTLPTNTKIIDSDEAFLLRENFNPPASSPATSIVNVTKIQESDHYSEYARQKHKIFNIPGNSAPPGSATSSASGVRRIPNGVPHVPTGSGTDSGSPNTGDLEVTSVTTDGMETNTKSDAEGTLGGTAQGLSITLSVEIEDGTFQTKKFEEEEETVPANSTSEVDLGAQEVAEKAKESQAKKQAELDQLLEEHHQLVSQIEELEKSRSVDGNSDNQSDVQDGDTA